MAELFVKICGLRELDHARVAMDAGADALGFVLAAGKRKVSPRVVAAIRDELGAAAPTIVGVTINETADALNRLTEAAGLDMVQLHGDESPELIRELSVPCVKALRFPAGTSVDAALEIVDAWLASDHPAARVIVEGHAPTGEYGGTGTRADWALAAEIARRYPIILAGGLAPANVREAITAVHPAGVDVSSGVELATHKHPALIRRFIAEARATQG